MGIFFGLIGLIIPLGLGLAGLFGGILAHRGFPTKGTWALIISSACYLLLVILLGVSQVLMFSSLTSGSGMSDTSWIEILLYGVMTLFVLSLIGMCLGAFWMTSNWKTLSLETAALEEKAQELASERDSFQKEFSKSS